MNRREFISGVAAGVGSLTLPGFGAEEAKPRRGVRAMYLKLGTRLDIVNPTSLKGLYLADRTRVYWDSLDRRVGMIAENGGNVALLDVGEALALECTRTVWPAGVVTGQEVAAHVAAWRKLGVQTVPLLNFSTVHSAWMGHPSRMTKTKPYWDFCTRAIAETLAVFRGTKVLHVGMDDEVLKSPVFKKQPYARVRTGDELWYTVNFFAQEAAKAGARIWLWGDVVREDPEGFRKNVTSDVIVSNRYLTSMHDKSAYRDLVQDQDKAYETLDKLGFSQIPCCTTSNCLRNEGKSDNPSRLASFIEKRVSPERLKGFVSFTHTSPGLRGENQYRKACELFGAAFCGKEVAS